ncbi:hypothetical protein HDU67_004003, partial [Dinochytrium kinnereticum]
TISEDLEEPLSQSMKLLGKLRGREVKSADDNLSSRESLAIEVSQLVWREKNKLTNNVHGPILLAVISSTIEDEPPPPPKDNPNLFRSRASSAAVINQPDSKTPSDDASPFSNLDTIQRRMGQSGPPDQVQMMIERYLLSPEVEVPVERPPPPVDEANLNEIRERLERLKRLAGKK